MVVILRRKGAINYSFAQPLAAKLRIALPSQRRIRGVFIMCAVLTLSAT